MSLPSEQPDADTKVLAQRRVRVAEAGSRKNYTHATNASIRAYVAIEVVAVGLLAAIILFLLLKILGISFVDSEIKRVGDVARYEQ